MVANLNVVDKITSGYDNTSTLVTADERKLGWQWPVTVDGVKISVADTGELDVDEDLIWTWLLDWDLLVLDWTAGLFDDLSPLSLWNFRHDGRMCVWCCIG